MYQKDLSSYQRKDPQIKGDVQWRVGDSRSESHRGDPIVIGINDCLQRLQGKDDQKLDGDAIEDVQETLGVKQGILDEEVIQPKDG